VQSLQEYHDVSVGTSEVVVSYGLAGTTAKFILEKVLSNVAAGIPFVGPFAADTIASIPTAIYEHYQKRAIKSEADENSTAFYKIGRSRIEQVIEETIHEITVIFEFQIAIMANEAIVAKAAVDKLFDTDKSQDRVTFDKIGLLTALVSVPKESRASRWMNRMTKSELFETLLSTGKSRVSWNERGILTSIGIRVANGYMSFEYLLRGDSKGKQPLCGYRTQMFSWNEDVKRFEPSQQDSMYSIPIECSDELLYEPYNWLVQQHEITQFFDQDIKSFVEYYRGLHTSSANIIPVFRNVNLPKKKLRAYDFSYTDKSRVEFDQGNCQDGRYDNCRLVSSYFNQTDLQNSSLQGADLRWCQLMATILTGDTVLLQANLMHCVFDEGTDLTNNSSLSSASNLDKAIFITNKIKNFVLQILSRQE
jgi:hypothetical protein